MDAFKITLSQFYPYCIQRKKIKKLTFSQKVTKFVFD